MSDPYSNNPDPYALQPKTNEYSAPSHTPQLSAGYQPANGAAPHPAANEPAPGGFPGYPVAEKPTSTTAIVSMTLGILSITMCAGLPAPFGLWFGLRGLKETQPGAAYSGNAIAWVGVITSAIGLLVFGIVLLYVGLIAVGMTLSLLS